MRRRAPAATVLTCSSFVEPVLRTVDWLGRRSDSVRVDAYTLYAKNARPGTTALAGTRCEVRGVSAAAGGCSAAVRQCGSARLSRPVKKQPRVKVSIGLEVQRA